MDLYILNICVIYYDGSRLYFIHIGHVLVHTLFNDVCPSRFFDLFSVGEKRSLPPICLK